MGFTRLMSIQTKGRSCLSAEKGLTEENKLIKMENNSENKAKLFAQYYGQNVYFVNQDGYDDSISKVPFNRINWSLNWCMLLRNVSSIC